MTKFNSITDAKVAFDNDGLFEAADLERQDEIVEYMYRNDADLEATLNALDAWI